MSATVAAPHTSEDQSLLELALHQEATITQINTPTSPAENALIMRLIEIGFLPGEKIRAIAHGHPGQEPIAVRLGHTTFALRRFEAGLIRVSRSTPQVSAR